MPVEKAAVQRYNACLYSGVMKLVARQFAAIARLKTLEAARQPPVFPLINSGPDINSTSIPALPVSAELFLPGFPPIHRMGVNA